MAKKLTEKQKAWLLKIHKKYGSAGLAPLIYVVRPGEQSHNFELKLKD
jgi:hypothetical protein